MKPKKNPLVIVFAILGVLTLCCGLPLGFVGYFGFKGIKAGVGMGQCAVNVKLMSDALKGYAAANGGKLPPAATWQTDLAKYFKVEKDMKDLDDLKGSPIEFKIWTANGEWSCGQQEKTGFAFNESLAGKAIEDVMKSSAKTPVIFETNKVAFNQHSKYVPVDNSKGPLMLEGMGDARRPWFLVMADGAIEGISDKKNKGSGDFQIDISSGDDSSSNQNPDSKNSQ
jgi:hypothetical protein